MEQKNITVLFAGGGTGGHLFPALAIADQIKRLRPNAQIVFVGTKKKLESRVVPTHGYLLRTIWISGFHRSIRLENLLFPMKVLVALMQSFFLIRAVKPDVVVGTGGYVAGPVLFAADILGIPTTLHESNSYPGLTTRLLSKRAAKVFLTFETTKKWLSRQDNIEVVGSPTREILGTVSREEAARVFNIDPNKKTLLVFGGSLGASSINRAMLTIARELVAAGLQLIWQTGQHGYQSIVATAQLPARSVWIGAFIDRMECAYAAADLVMCRAGATTLAELARLGKPAVLVPYPHAAADHQVINARALVDAGAAEMILDHQLESGAKEKILKLMANDDVRRRMSENSRKLGRPEAARDIARKILKML